MRVLALAISLVLLWSCGGDDSPNRPPGDQSAGSPSGGENEAAGGTTHGDAGTHDGDTSSGGTSSGETSSGGAPSMGTGGAGDFGDWSVDSSFGSDGFATAGTSRSNDLVTAVERQDDGKVLVAGTDHPGADLNGQVSGNVLVARLDPDGALDETFGVAGFVRVPIGYRAQADTLEVQADGKVIVVGQAHTTVASGTGFIQPFVLRLLPSGELDPSFGEQGVVVLAQVASFSGSALQSDGKILAVGGASGQLQMVRLTAAGMLDSTFGTAGVVMQSGDVAVGSLVARDITTTSSGQIVVVGQTTKDLGDVLVFRYSSNGTPDDSFGTKGRVVTALGSQYDIGNAVEVGSDGSIWVVGRATDTSQPCGAFGCPVAGVVLRYDSSGDLDPAFGGGDGWVTIGGELTQVSVLDDGRLLATGSGKIVALLPDGTPDDTFGTAGVSSVFNFVRAAIAPDGETVLVARAEDQAAQQAELIATRVDPFGMADPDYGVAGSARFGSGGMADMALNVVEGSAQTLLVLGTTQRFYPLPTTFSVSRHAGDGTLDSSFGDDGFITLKSMVYGAELLHTADGKILAVGTSVPLATWLFGVHRLDANGLHDETFGTAGVAEEALIDQGGSHARAAALQTDGKLVVAGYVIASNNSDLALLRLDTEGAPDATFGTDGRVIVDAGLQLEQLHDVALTSSGQIVAVGSGGLQGASVLLGRWNEDGSPDETFGEGGLAKPTLAAGVFLDDLALQPDGKLLVAGYRRGPSGLIVARFLEDGSLDPSFANGGIFVHEDPEIVPFGTWVRGPQLVVLEDGGILVAGTRKPSYAESPLLLQLGPDGALSGARTAAGRGSWTGFGATLLTDGDLLTVGRGFSETGGTDYGLVRFTR
jgi:uncharacterized delta-60 repeat protein